MADPTQVKVYDIRRKRLMMKALSTVCGNVAFNWIHEMNGKMYCDDGEGLLLYFDGTARTNHWTRYDWYKWALRKHEALMRYAGNGARLWFVILTTDGQIHAIDLTDRDMSEFLFVPEGGRIKNQRPGMTKEREPEYRIPRRKFTRLDPEGDAERVRELSRIKEEELAEEAAKKAVA